MPCADDAVHSASSPAAAATNRGGILQRTLQVLRAVWQHLLLPWLRRQPAPPRAQRMQAVLEELGGTWIKLGQALALRFDILPADYCLQFFQLLNQVRPFPAAAVRQTIERELGRTVEDLFGSFDWNPIAAASIGQVHRAELHDGTVVAVKVQRPGIRDLVRTDLRIMHVVAAGIDSLPVIGRMHARGLVRELARWTEEELDYRLEARHAAVLRHNAGGDSLEHNPRVFLDYTSARVLTLEYVAGIAVIDIISALRNRDTAFLADLVARGHDTRRIASHIVWNALNQVYRFGYFHADPHPANLIVLPDDAIGYVDFGIVGKLDNQTTDRLRYFAQSLFAGHVGKAVDEFMRFLEPSSATDISAARRDLIEALKGYLESERVGPGGFTLSDGVFEIEMLAVVRKHAMAVMPDAILYLKAVLTAEAMVKELDPQFDLRAHENRFFGRLMQIELSESLSPGNIAQWLVDARFRANRVLESIETAGATPVQLIALSGNVRRRVQSLFVLMLLGWGAVLAALVVSPEWSGWGASLRWLGVAAALVSVVALLLSIRQIRRLPYAGESGLAQYPRRLR